MTAASARPDNAQPARLDPWLLWAGLLFAFSPTLVDLARHMLDQPWARYAALFPFLFARAARARPAGVRRRSGLLWVAFGMALELFGILGGIPKIGRVGLVLAAVGLCRHLGWGEWREWVLLALSVPIPSLALFATSPGAEYALASAASACLNGLGVAGLEVSRSAVHYGGQELALTHFDSGMALVPLLGGISWYGSLRRRLPTRAALVRAIGTGLLGLPGQLVAVVLALLSLPLGAASAGRWALSELPWVIAAGVSLAVIEWGLHRGETTHEG
jgi:hypothetical protein